MTEYKKRDFEKEKRFIGGLFFITLVVFGALIFVLEVFR